ncbi:hypothetical protein LTR33_000597 [Friedmanniomyces endolithicus]|nr:hypothetical protein LTR33_000597 [Friedmanniomyces endolithicus]
MEQTAARDRATSTISTPSIAASGHGHRRTTSTKLASKPPGSSVISLLLTNLRLLDFDLFPDCPGITNTSLGNHDARARIRSVEFALFHLFKLHDPATTSDKLQPFYPPLEPLQGINLRAALYRCLNDLKKNGVLGKEVALRKTMLDECQGDKFWELCLSFSALVLRKVTLEKKHTYARHRHGPPVAERLGTAQAETELLARKAHVQEQSRSKLPQARLDKLNATEANVRGSWVGSEELKEVLLGGYRADDDSVLTGHLSDVAQAFVTSSEDLSLLQALEQTASRQNQRVRKWQSMHEGMVASRNMDGQVSTADTQTENIKLRFDKHRPLNLRDAPQQPADQPRQRSDTHTIVSKYDEILTAMREELRSNRRATAPTPSPTKTAAPHQRPQPPGRIPSVHLDTLGGAYNPRQPSPSRSAMSMRSAVSRRVSSRSSSRSYIAPKVEGQRHPIPLKSEFFSPLEAKRRSCSSPLSSSSMLATPVEELTAEASLTARGPKDESRPVSGSSETNSAIDSGVGIDVDGTDYAAKRKGHGNSDASIGEVDAHVVATPDRTFKKPVQPAPPAADTASTPRPSLAERTRMSMAFRSAEDVHSKLPEPPTPTRSEDATQQAPVRSDFPQQSARGTTLAERTRQSISLAPPPPITKPAAQHIRTRSSIYPVNQFDTPRKPRPSSVISQQQEGNEGTGGGRRDVTPREQLLSPEAEYDSVFRPRPKIKMSPVSSPGPSPAIAGRVLVDQ